MDTNLILSNLLSPPILFFFLGVLAVAVRSDLEIPQPIPKFLSLYLLFAIGFRGGTELHESGLTSEVGIALAAAMAMAFLVPLYSFFILRVKLPVADAAAIAATYGSISAVTFITAASFLQRLDVGFGGHLVAAMALMESPAIVVGVLLYNIHARGERRGIAWGEVLREAFLNGSVFLILGSLMIGVLTGAEGASALAPFAEDIFKGMLAFFLLDMGLIAARRLGDLRRGGLFLTLFAIVIPMVNAMAAIAIANLIGMSRGDALMFAVLCASASYIAVPAAMRLSIPDANPSLYVPMSLAITFPFNIVVGLPLYMQIIELFWR
ncbi:MAG TPA: sodium-dependent bicarbonate transport family permease [Thermoanaerobaculia bacterium]|nr:sodium-dependent bicarbonate transport family permease [Thermoanaerobaculia bacterium]